MNSALRNSLLAIGFAAFVGCKPAEQATPGALAEVNGRPVTAETFRYWWQRDLRADDSAESRKALLQQLIERSALVQKAQAAGIDRDPQIVESIESLLIARLKEKELQPKIEAISVSEQEALAFYNAHKDERYAEPERVHAAVLWFETRGQEPLIARYRPRLEQARQQILDGNAAAEIANGFGNIALQNSEHTASRYKGGDVGWLTSTGESDDWRKAVADIATTLTYAGEISPVVANKEGLFVVRLIERRPMQYREFASVRAQIERHLRNDKRERLEQQFLAEINCTAVIREHSEQLTALSGLPTRTNSVALSKSNETVFHPQL